MTRLRIWLMACEAIRMEELSYLLAGLALKRDVHVVLVHPAAIPKCLSTLGLFNCADCRVWAVRGHFIRSHSCRSGCGQKPEVVSRKGPPWMNAA